MDFEALGRYTDAVEKAKRLAEEYSRKSDELATLIQRGAGRNFATHLILPAFDTSGAKVKMQELATLFRSLEAQCDEANLYASKCGKEPIRKAGAP